LHRQSDGHEQEAWDRKKSGDCALGPAFTLGLKRKQAAMMTKKAITLNKLMIS